MMPPRFFWKLIFHSGPLAGQSLHLPNGDITLGDTPECDVQLALPKRQASIVYCGCLSKASGCGCCACAAGSMAVASKVRRRIYPRIKGLIWGGANLVLRARAKMRPCRASKAAGTESACSA